MQWIFWCLRIIDINSISGIVGKAVHFYGNDGVCVFKYLVRQDDPQKWFSLGVLGINFACFVIISACYVIISIRAITSSETTARNDDSQHRRDIQLKISAIIFTDFLCWIPLTMVCFLHNGNIIDATEWYPIFTIVLLPINSVINPVLYNGDITKMLIKPVKVINRSSHEIASEIQRAWEARRGTLQADTVQ